MSAKPSWAIWAWASPRANFADCSLALWVARWPIATRESKGVQIGWFVVEKVPPAAVHAAVPPESVVGRAHPATTTGRLFLSLIDQVIVPVACAGATVAVNVTAVEARAGDRLDTTVVVVVAFATVCVNEPEEPAKIPVCG